MNKKGFSVPQSPLWVSWDLILPHRIIDEARSRKQHSYEDTRKLQIAGRATQRARVKKTNKNSNNNDKSLTVESQYDSITVLGKNMLLNIKTYEFF